MPSALGQINQTHILPSFSLGRSATYLKQDVLQERASWRTTPYHLLMTTYSMHLQLDSMSGSHIFHFQPQDVT
jgi:predicted LPLAT superfamily acyltransferase